MAKTRNISLPDEIMERMEQEAKKMGLNCSAYISMTLSQRWQNEETLRAIPQLVELARKADQLEKSGD